MKELERQKILIDADYCWRHHHTTLFWGAYLESLGLDMRTLRIFSNIMDIGDGYLSNKQRELRDELEELERQMLDKGLKFHPALTRHDKIYKIVENIYQNGACSASLRFLLYDYFVLSKQPSKRKSLIRDAIKIDGGNPRFCIEYKEIVDGAYSSWERGAVMNTIDIVDGTVLCFTSVVEMAIGHYFAPIDVLEYIKCTIGKESLLKRKISIVFLLSGRSVCEQAEDLILERYQGLDIMIKKVKPSEVRPEYLCNAWKIMPSLNSLKVDLGLNRTLKTKVGGDKKMCVMHLRTKEYKNNDNDPIMSSRSVAPGTYQKVVDNLKSKGYKITLLTANEMNELPRGIEINMADCAEGKKRQWELLSEADFMIGTFSGISNFCALTECNALYTNFVCLPSDRLLSETSVICTKNFKICKEMEKLGPKEKFYMYLRPWAEGEQKLLDYVEITDNLDDQLERACIEFLEAREGKINKDNRLHAILEDNELATTARLWPNWLLFSDSAANLRELLSSKCRADRSSAIYK